MSTVVERLALADAMQLHNERVERADAECRRLRAELEAAEIRQAQARDSRIAFMRAIKENQA